MERKIGEIFEFGGEWYQCVESNSHGECSLFTTECGSGTKSDLADKIFGRCSKVRRKDNKDVIFKKLEKVGEPYRRWLSSLDYIIVQKYKLYDKNVLMPNKPCMYPNVVDNTIEIIKQTKEDMEEKNNAKHSNSEKIGKNLKEFDLEAAKSGKPICTRDGRKARIICFDKKRSLSNSCFGK